MVHCQRRSLTVRPHMVQWGQVINPMKKLLSLGAVTLLLAAGCTNLTAQRSNAVDIWDNPIPSAPGCRILGYEAELPVDRQLTYVAYQVDGTVDEKPPLTWVKNFNGTSEQIVWSSTDATVAEATSRTGYQNSLQLKAVGSAIVRASDTSLSGPCYVEYDITVK